MSFHDIPHEMRSYAQWVCWRYEETSNGKPTKIPYCPQSGKLANVNDPQTFGTFEQALAASHFYNGIGFVLTENDPYAFIDLDNPHALNLDGTPKFQNAQELLDRQIKIYTEFNSFSERSPSGTGLHVIVKGSVPAGRRRGSIEVYSSQRYMTMTGDVYRACEIEPRQAELTQLWEQLGGFRSNTSNNVDEPQREDDATVIDRASRAANGQKFEALFKGEWIALGYSSQSEADFALIDILAFYTQSREQIARIFIASALGQREKAKRQDYISHMIGRSFDRITPQVDLDGLNNQLSLALEGKKEQQPQPIIVSAPPEIETQLALPGVLPDEKPQHLTNIPPGLVGHIAQFIYDAAPRPVPDIALAGAIGLMAGICGRGYNVSRTGLNQYTLLLAPTGTGKEAMSGGIDKLMATIRTSVSASSSFIGPGDIMSGQALLKYISRNAAYPCFVSIVGEFGLFLKQLSSDYANSSQLQLRRLLLDLFNKSGITDSIKPAIYSDKANDTVAVLAPSFSVLGETVPETFYEALDTSMIASGLLPRFTIVEYKGPRVPENENHANVYPSMELVEKLGAMTSHAHTLMHANRAINVKLNFEAKSDARALNKFVDNIINQSEREVVKQLWNRVHIKTLKLAALVAVGCNPYEPEIDRSMFEWANSLVTHDVLNLVKRFDAGMIGTNTEETQQSFWLKKIIRRYYKGTSEQAKKLGGNDDFWLARIIPYAYIQRQLVAQSPFRRDRSGATNAIKRTLQTFVDNGTLVELSKIDLMKRFNTGQRGFILQDIKLLEERDE